jgi:hypothetical protein
MSRFLTYLTCWVALLLVAACGAVPPAERSATATAQSLRASRLATQMATYMQATLASEAAQISATVQARQALLSEAQNWPIQFSDQFEDNANEWPSGDKTDPLATINWKIDAGKFYWLATANDSFVWRVTVQEVVNPDFYLSAEVQQTAGPASAEAGLVFHNTDNSEYYLFEINSQRQFAVYLRAAGDWQALIDWTDSPTIQETGVNRLAVIAQGSQYSFFANGQYLAGLTETRLTRGRQGLLIGLSEAGDEGAWEFDNFEVRWKE